MTGTHKRNLLLLGALIVAGAALYFVYGSAKAGNGFLGALDNYDQLINGHTPLFAAADNLGSTWWLRRTFRDNSSLKGYLSELNTISAEREQALLPVNDSLAAIDAQIERVSRRGYEIDFSEYDRIAFQILRRFDTIGQYGLYEAANISTGTRVVLEAPPELLGPDRGSRLTLFVRYIGEEPIQMQSRDGRPTVTEYFHTYRVHHSEEQEWRQQEREEERQSELRRLRGQRGQVLISRDRIDREFRRQVDEIVRALNDLRSGEASSAVAASTSTDEASTEQPSEQPTTSSPVDEVEAEQPTVLDNADSAPEAVGSGTVDRLRQGMRYSEARRIILEAGWQAPLRRWQDMEDLWGRERDMIVDLGWHELMTCSGTGMGFCRFEFGDAQGRTLVVVTIGEADDPSLHSWSIE